MRKPQSPLTKTRASSIARPPGVPALWDVVGGRWSGLVVWHLTVSPHNPWRHGRPLYFCTGTLQEDRKCPPRKAAWFWAQLEPFKKKVRPPLRSMRPYNSKTWPCQTHLLLIQSPSYSIFYNPETVLQPHPRLICPPLSLNSAAGDHSTAFQANESSLSALLGVPDPLIDRRHSFAELLSKTPLLIRSHSFYTTV